MELFKIKITIIAEVSSAEYENIETIIDELGSESNYEIPSTENVEVHNTEWVDTTPYETITIGKTRNN